MEEEDTSEIPMPSLSFSGNVYTALTPQPEDSSRKDARITDLEAELAKKDAKIADLDSLKGAWGQLLSIYQEMDDKWAKARADYGDDRRAIDASGILDTPDWARFNFEEEYDCINKVYDRIPVVFRGF